MSDIKGGERKEMELKRFIAITIDNKKKTMYIYIFNVPICMLCFHI